VLISLTDNDELKPVLKLGDFGLGKMSDKSSVFLSTLCGTVIYWAPELVEVDCLSFSNPKYNYKVDIWYDYKIQIDL
jgi:serine/threonine protein kinase